MGRPGDGRSAGRRPGPGEAAGCSVGAEWHGSARTKRVRRCPGGRSRQRTTAPSTGIAARRGGRRRCSVGTVERDADAVPTTKQLLRWGEALAGIARTGLGFTESLYERERYEEVLRVAADIRAAAEEGLADGQDAAGLVEEWLSSVGRGVPGYVTPKVAVGAIVGNDSGELLLVRRADSGVWLYPTGWADVGYSAAEVVAKEVEEETGVEVEVERLIAVLDGFRVGMSRIPMYSLVFQCRPVGGELRAHPLECADVGWFPLDALPEPLAGIDRWGPQVTAVLRGEPVDVLYDPVRRPVWRGNDG